MSQVTLAAAALILALLVAGYWVYADLVNPSPFYARRYDPEMAYLLNSLAIFKSRPYAYYDHPGTPVEVVGTAFLALTRPLLQLRSEAFWDYVLANPQPFLQVAHGFLTAGSIATLMLLCLRSVRVRTRSDLLVALGVGTSFFALLPRYAFNSLVLWSHNSFNFPFGTLLLFLLYLRLRSGRPTQLWETAALGLAAGALTAVQLYFAVWVVGIAVSLGVFVVLTARSVARGVAAAAALGAASLLGFFLATGPILHKYREIAWWVGSLIVHQGKYGQGPAGLPTPTQLFANLAEQWSDGWTLYVGSGIALLLLGAGAFLGRKELAFHPGRWAVALGLSIQMLLIFLLIGKHPGPIYLLAPAAVAPVLLLIAVEGVAEHDRLRLLTPLLGLALVVSFVAGLLVAVARQREANNRLEERRSEVQGMIDLMAARLERDPGELVLLWGYGTESPCYALRFGDRYAGGAFSREINELCPQDWAYEASTGIAELLEGGRPLGEAEGWDLLILRASDVSSDLREYGELSYSSDRSLAFLRAADR